MMCRKKNKKITEKCNLERVERMILYNIIVRKDGKA